MKKVISIFLLTVLLLGNVGFTYGTHYCMGMAVDSELMLGHEHMDCGMGMDESTPMDQDQTHFSSPTCCENQYVSIETDDAFTKTLSVEIHPTFVEAIAVNVLYTLEIIPSNVQPIAFDTSPPPLLKYDVIVLHQVFRI